MKAEGKPGLGPGLTGPGKIFLISDRHLEIVAVLPLYCRNRMNVSEPEIDIRPKSAANSILTSNHLTGHRIDYGNGNDYLGLVQTDVPQETGFA